MKNLAALLMTAAVACDAHAANELRIDAAQLAAQYSSGALPGADIARHCAGKRVALTGTLLSLDEGLTGDVVGKLGGERDQAVRVVFANQAVLAKMRKRVGQTLTLHCVGEWSTGFATASGCKPD